MTREGSLTVAGSGISVPSQATLQAVAAIRGAGKVFYIAADPLTPLWMRELNPNVESLASFYEQGTERRVSYERMIERVLEAVRSGEDVCFLAYGHPGVFAYPTHEALRRARAEGYRAVMQPGVSAEDCLIADLGFDPGTTGAQSFEATDFLIHRRIYDPRSGLILWQVGAIGVMGIAPERTAWNPKGVAVLAETLAAEYGEAHEVTVYEAPLYAVAKPEIRRMALSALAGAGIGVMSTLFVPPKPTGDADAEMLARIMPGA